MALPLLLLIAAPGIALLVHERGLAPKQTHTEKLAEQVEQAWHSLTEKPLRYVGGDADLAYGVISYAHDRPQALPGLPQPTEARLRNRGAVLLCYAEDTGCTVPSSRIASENPASLKIETKLERNYLGVSGASQSYVIFIVPPQQPSST